MPPRDRTPQLLAAVNRARSTTERSEQAARAARKAYRVALMKASAGGVSTAELARLGNTSDSRIRQSIKQARAETER